MNFIGTVALVRKAVEIAIPVFNAGRFQILATVDIDCFDCNVCGGGSGGDNGGLWSGFHHSFDFFTKAFGIAASQNAYENTDYNDGKKNTSKWKVFHEESIKAGIWREVKREVVPLLRF